MEPTTSVGLQVSSETPLISFYFSIFQGVNEVSSSTELDNSDGRQVWNVDKLLFIRFHV